MAIQLNVRTDIRGDIRTGSDALQCPVCGGYYLHHNNIRAWCRDDEDLGGTVFRIFANDGMTPCQPQLDTKQFAAAALTSRRNIIEIDFKCENGCLLTAELRQHKGYTFLVWTKTQPKP